MKKNILDESISRIKASKLLGVSTGALRYWEAQGWLVPERTAGGHRRYLLRSVIEFSKRKEQLANLSLSGLGKNV